MSKIPIVPALSLQKDTIRLAKIELVGDVIMAAAADGSVWIAYDDKLYVYSYSRASFVFVVDLTFGSPNLGPDLAPVNVDLVYYIGRASDGESVVSVYRTNSGSSVLRDQPGAPPTAIAAACDGALWALGTDGVPYAYHFDKWTPLPVPPGTVFRAISIGSEAFGLAFAMQDGAACLLQYSDGAWTRLSDATEQQQWVGACSDGSYWRVYGENVALHLVGGRVVEFALGKPLIGSLSGPSKHGCYYLETDLRGGVSWLVSCFACAVLTQAPEAWPAMSPAQRSAYRKLSRTLQIEDIEGVRSQYGNLNAPIETWHTELSSMPCPEGVDPFDWRVVQLQISEELKCVASVSRLFGNLRQLTDMIRHELILAYESAVSMVQLPAQSANQPHSTVEIVLGTILSKLLEAAIARAPAGAGKAITIGMSVVKFAVGQIAKTRGAPNLDTAIKLACCDLLAFLSDIGEQMVQTNGDSQKTIVSDWGKLRDCGQAIMSGVWYWDPDFKVEVLRGIGDSARIGFYQTLMPVKWQIVCIQTLFYMGGHCPHPFPDSVPAYALLYKFAEDKQRRQLYWWWICTERGAEATRRTQGAFPNQHLIQEIIERARLAGSDRAAEDFFSGSNGWNLPVVTGEGYNPPDSGLPWQPWSDSPNPLSK